MNKLKTFFFTIIITFIFVFVAFVTYNLAEPKAYDFMTKHVLTQKLPFDNNKKIHGSDDIVLVVIDSQTVEKYRWPWKRDLNCKIFEYFLKYANEKVVTYDAIITALDKENIEADKKFFNTLNKFDNLVVGFMPSMAPWKSEQDQLYDNSFAKYQIRVEDKTSKNHLLFESLMKFPLAYLNSIKHAGSVCMLSGPINGNITEFARDEIYRNHEYFFKYNNGIYPSLAFKSFLLAKNSPQIIISDKFLEIPELKYKIKLTKNDYQYLSPVKFYNLKDGVYSHKKYSALEIMNSYDALKAGKKPIINPKEFENKIVVIGANVPAGTGLNDNKNTPILSNFPGIDYQATAIDNILHNDFLKIIPQWINILFTLIGMLFVYGFIRVCNLAKSISNTLIMVGTYLFISATCFYFGIVINVLTPIVMFVLTMILGYTHKFVLENRSKEKVKSAMGKYMSQDVMKRVIQDIDNLGLGGKRANVTVLFSDIRGFTSMSEQMTPQQVSEILNEYFTEMEPIITQYNGIINKFIGDAVMAIFGEPIQNKNHASNAVKCAYSMLKRVKELQKKWALENKPKIEIGIGIATGEVFVGNIGSINRMEYTVIGDTVNLASRLEGYNKTYKTKLLISPATYEEVKGIVDVIKISDVQIRGKVNKMDIYEVLRVM